MLDVLETLATRAEEMDPWLGRARYREIQQWQTRLPKNAPVEYWVRAHFTLGMEEIRNDSLRSGIDSLLKAYELLPSLVAQDQEHRYQRDLVIFELGVAYLRLGETENCCLRNAPESCIVPIRDGGLHTETEGSRTAIKYFLEVLDVSADNQSSGDAVTKEEAFLPLMAQWLLNIAFMTLGEYPDKVPPEYLIAPKVFDSEIEFPRFPNIAPQLGVNSFDSGGGAIIEDFDNDDDLDILTSSWDPRGPSRLYLNNADGSFTETTESAGLVGLYGGFNMIQADYDNDGDADVFMMRGAWRQKEGRIPNSLIRNNGDGTFTDVSFAAGIADDQTHYPTKTAAWADYDNDGHVDLYVGNESTPNVLRAPCQLFHNNGDGTFTDVAQQAGVLEFCFASGSAWGDYNGDRYPDLYLSTGGTNRLYRNNGDGTFTDVARTLGVDRPDASFPVWFWDFDNDGILDLYVATSAGPVGLLTLYPTGVDPSTANTRRNAFDRFVSPRLMCLYRGDGRGGFLEVAAEYNLTYPAQVMGCNFGDLDNDGYLDFYLGTGSIEYHELRPNVMFLNQRGRSFINVTMAGGFGHLQKGHGISFADLDHDGDQDVYAQMGGAWRGDKYGNVLFENPGFENHWITVKLTGTRSNASAIGARIHVQVVEDGQLRSIYKYVDTGGSFGTNPLRQTLGLGKATKIERLEIFWPTTGLTQTFDHVPMDRFIRISEGESRYREVAVRTFNLGSTSPASTR